jgi:hypothetical protein
MDREVLKLLGACEACPPGLEDREVLKLQIFHNFFSYCIASCIDRVSCIGLCIAFDTALL